MKTSIFCRENFQNMSRVDSKTFSLFLGGVKKISRKNHASQDGQICNFVTLFLKHARNPMFLGMGNHLEPFSKVSEPPEGQEQGGGAVGGQGRHQGVKL